MAQIPTPDFAVPYAAPKQVKTIADVQPMAPKNGCVCVSLMILLLLLWRRCGVGGWSLAGAEVEGYELHRPG